jgi:tRNA (guanine26-N2/guanine27-N2)-dimethyltransferase
MLTRRSAKEADESLREIGFILHCYHCGSRKIVRSLLPVKDQKCDSCGSNMRFAGPLWCGQIWSKPFTEAARVIVSEPEHKINHRLIRMLDLILSELDGPATYYDLHVISDSEGVNSPSTTKVVELLRKKGFFASPTHFRGTCVRTNADMETIRSAVKQMG